MRYTCFSASLGHCYIRQLYMVDKRSTQVSGLPLYNIDVLHTQRLLLKFTCEYCSRLYSLWPERLVVWDPDYHNR